MLGGANRPKAKDKEVVEMHRFEPRPSYDVMKGLKQVPRGGTSILVFSRAETLFQYQTYILDHIFVGSWCIEPTHVTMFLGVRLYASGTFLSTK